MVCVEGVPVRMGSRAFDVLELLAEANGALVTKDDIMQRVWPDTVVEENNLQVHVAAIRKVLGKDRGLLLTVPGRGYRLDGVKPGRAANDGECESHPHPVNALRPLQNLPLALSPIEGREGAIADVFEALRDSSIVTLIGAGGIGKTRLAIEVARRLQPHFPDGLCFVSLASVSEPQQVLGAMAEALGAGSASDIPVLDDVVRDTAGRRILVIVDSCEHVVEEAASIVERLCSAVGLTRFLVTGREALGLSGERLYRVPPLDVPPPDAGGAEILRHSSVKLFLSRARAVDPSFSQDERSVLLTGEVCRQLDGIPLAIELAAARGALLGVEVLATRLDDQLDVLSGGYRTALPRHQTLKATFDWSYRLLTREESVLLRWLGVFVDVFTFDAVCQVAARIGATEPKAMEALSGLVSKSLVVRADGGLSSRYRLLSTTRSYARQLLEECGERELAEHARAAWLCGRFARTGNGTSYQSADDALADFRNELGDVRAALGWAFSDPKYACIGFRLAGTAVPLMLRLSLVGESTRWGDAAWGLVRAWMPDCGAAGQPPSVAARAPSRRLMDDVQKVSPIVSATRLHAGEDGCDFSDASSALQGLSQAYRLMANPQRARAAERWLHAMTREYGQQIGRQASKRIPGAGVQVMGGEKLAECMLVRVAAEEAYDATAGQGEPDGVVAGVGRIA
ncbi:ATP-binding protein [Paraburkholderia caballeronis]|uniref:Predicted ATPase n=1 Tax=Paraburkholderia caballeronis TaxID=416943 RepID=A0A1H7L7M9_9BURK|nr:winged helix-turn-helix domain-containing protein [Paraburkholderia caballeronis]PXW28320.1 winged helix family transcriptional regulator [Paraburkholderia caballeronis]PXX03686.1 winged helix family transcriptional regulator [Paraburkholderia caballeronis]RAK04430.1 winged helix family transcriptional regulator [Paraburkholderia caballeronis]SEK94726.1 Predicted ATPase [Paraburkholderia caballeronis]